MSGTLKESLKLSNDYLIKQLDKLKLLLDRRISLKDIEPEDKEGLDEFITEAETVLGNLKPVLKEIALAKTVLTTYIKEAEEVRTHGRLTIFDYGLTVTGKEFNK